MELNEEELLSQVCTDLVTLRRYQGVVRILLEEDSLQWFAVCDLLALSDITLKSWRSAWNSSLFCCVLPHPADEPDYRVILFYHAAQAWNLVATYNAANLEEPR